MQTQLNHVVTQGSKLDESGDWDQQANWANRGIPLWVRDEKLGYEALSLKEEETVQKGQAAEAQAPYKAEVYWWGTSPQEEEDCFQASGSEVGYL